MPTAAELESWPEAGADLDFLPKWSKSAQASVGRSLRKCLDGKDKDRDRDRKGDKNKDKEEEISQKRKELDLEVTASSQSSRSSNLPGPWGGFEELRRSLPQIPETSLGSPTPLQSQVIPLCLAGHDVLASAQPGVGSGKFLTMLLPALVHIQHLDRSEALPRALVLFPTRESAEAFRNAAQSILKKSDYDKNVQPWAGCCTSGVVRQEQVRELETWKFHLMVGTPNRLLDFVRTKVLSLEGVTFLVVAQANLLAEASFGDEVALLQRAIRPQRQVLVMTSTVTPAVEDLCSNFHSEHGFVRVTAKLSGRSTPDSKAEDVGKSALGPDQQFDIIDTTASSHPLKQKGELLVKRLDMLGNVQALIFVKDSGTAEILTRKLAELLDVKVGCIHKLKSQESRLFVVQCYVQKQLKYLVTTEAIFRGVDLPCTHNVLIFDLGDMNAYVEQVNKARDYSGRPGSVLTFFELGRDEKADAVAAGKLVEFVQQRRQQPPQALLDVARGTGAPRQRGNGAAAAESKKEPRRRDRRSRREGSRSRSVRSNRKEESRRTSSRLKLSSRSPTRARPDSLGKQGFSGEYGWSRRPRSPDASGRRKHDKKHSRREKDRAERSGRSTQQRKRKSPQRKKARRGEKDKAEEVAASSSSSSSESGEDEDSDSEVQSSSNGSAAGWDDDSDSSSGSGRQEEEEDLEDLVSADSDEAPPKPSASPAVPFPLNLALPPPAAPSSKAASRASQAQPMPSAAAFITAESGMAMPRPKSGGVAARPKEPSSPTSSVGSAGRRASVNDNANNANAGQGAMQPPDGNHDNDADSTALAVFAAPPPLEARPKLPGWSLGSAPQPPPPLQDRRTGRKARKAKQAKLEQEWQAKLEASQKEKADLEQQLAGTQSHLAEMQASQETLTQTVEAQKSELMQQKQESQRLESECTRLRNVAREKEASLEESTKLHNAHVQDLQSQLQSVTSKWEALSNYLSQREKELDEQKEELSQRLEEAAKDQQAFEEKREQLSRQQAEQEKARQILEADRKGLLLAQEKWEMEEQQRQRAAGNQGNDVAGEDALDRRVLRQKLREAEAEKDRLAQQVEALSDNGFFFQEREEQIQMLEARVSDFDKQWSELEAEKNRWQEHAAKLQKQLESIGSHAAAAAATREMAVQPMSQAGVQRQPRSLPSAAEAEAQAQAQAQAAASAPAAAAAAAAASAAGGPQAIPQEVQPIDVESEVSSEVGRRRRRRRRPREDPAAPTAPAVAAPHPPPQAAPAPAPAAAPVAAAAAAAAAAPAVPPHQAPPLRASTAASAPAPAAPAAAPAAAAVPVTGVSSALQQPPPTPSGAPPPAAHLQQFGVQMAVPTSKRGGAKRPPIAVPLPKHSAAAAAVSVVPAAAPTPKHPQPQPQPQPQAQIQPQLQSQLQPAAAPTPKQPHGGVAAAFRASATKTMMSGKESESGSSSSGSSSSSSSSDGDDPGHLF